MSTTPRPQPLGLLERRKIQTMLEIQDVALRLFESEGYRQVSVEQIASAARVSPSTVYRHFGTKENLIVWDDIDHQVIEMLGTDAGVSTPAELQAAIDRGTHRLVAALLGSGNEERIKRRVLLMVAEADIKAGQLRRTRQLEAELRGALATRLGRSEAELLVRIAAAEAIWGIVAAIDYWADGGFTDPMAKVLEQTADVIVDVVGVVLTRISTSGQ
ncbi:TetR/AcrR family transcriptional regulator [Nocardia tengchongensis]|uniref:TetR/AcrR family transcriptional regulator n=1 Tax=Nocardia tengchongensis TaxID=2055889 RepID=UPI0036789AE2